MLTEQEVKERAANALRGPMSCGRLNDNIYAVWSEVSAALERVGLEIAKGDGEVVPLLWCERDGEVVIRLGARVRERASSLSPAVVVEVL